MVDNVSGIRYRRLGSFPFELSPVAGQWERLGILDSFMMLRVRLCWGLALVGALGGAAFGHAEKPRLILDHVYPSPTGTWLKTAVWGDPGYVMAGWNGEILFSEDLREWSRMVVPEARDVHLNAAVYFKDKFLVVGQEGVVLSSENGRSWTWVETGSRQSFRAAAGGNDTLVLAGDGDTLVVSAGGEPWIEYPAPESFKDLAFGNGLWVATTGGSSLYTSTNLIEWRVVRLDAFLSFWFGPVFNSVCFANDRFVVAGAWANDDFNGSTYGSVVMISEDGVEWQSAAIETFGEIRDLVPAHDRFVGVTTEGAVWSENGEVWHSSDPLPSQETMRALAASPEGEILAVGDLGEILVSADARAWRDPFPSAREYFSSVEEGAGTYVAVGGRPHYLGGPVGSSLVLASEDGRNWTSSLADLDDELSDVAYGDGVWVVVGKQGRIFSSSDAVHWTDRSDPEVWHYFHQVAYGNGRFVVFSQGRDILYESAHGTRWRRHQAAYVDRIFKVRFLNGHFLAGGGAGQVLYSKYGLTWDVRDTGTSFYLSDFAFGKGRYVAGASNALLHSPDGRTWIPHPVDMSVRSVGYVDGWFLAVGFRNRMLASLDGIRWQPVAVPSFNEGAIQALAAGSRGLVLMGGLSLYHGALVEPDGFKDRIHWLMTGEVEFWGDPQYQYLLLQSPDLRQWRSGHQWWNGRDDWLRWNVEPMNRANLFFRVQKRLRR